MELWKMTMLHDKKVKMKNSDRSQNFYNTKWYDMVKGIFVSMWEFGMIWFGTFWYDIDNLSRYGMEQFAIVWYTY